MGEGGGGKPQTHEHPSLASTLVSDFCLGVDTLTSESRKRDIGQERRAESLVASERTLYTSM